jgi:hypothetical protein
VYNHFNRGTPALVAPVFVTVLRLGKITLICNPVISINVRVKHFNVIYIGALFVAMWLLTLLSGKLVPLLGKPGLEVFAWMYLNAPLPAMLLFHIATYGLFLVIPGLVMANLSITDRLQVCKATATAIIAIEWAHLLPVFHKAPPGLGYILVWLFGTGIGIYIGLVFPTQVKGKIQRKTN